MARKALALAIPVAGAVYLGLVWGSGYVTKTQFDKASEKLAASQFKLLKVVKQDYQQGFFTSVNTVTYALDASAFAGADDSAEAEYDFGDEEEFDYGDESESYEESAEQDEATYQPAVAETGEAADELLEFTVRHKITHGPFPGFALGWAHIDTEFVFSEETKKEMKEAIGTDRPVEIGTRLTFAGGAVTKVKSPAFQMKDEDGTLSWKGLEGTFDLGRNAKSLDGGMTAPEMLLETSDGKKMAMRGLTFDFDLDEAFESIYVGDAAFKIAELTSEGADASDTFRLKDIAYIAGATRDGDFVDVTARFGAGGVNMAGMDVSNVRYDIAFKHLHGPTYSTIQKKFQEIAFTGPEASGQMMTALSEAVPALLEHNPEFVIERIGFNLPQGEFGISGSVKLDGFTKEDAAMGMFAALGKLNAAADIWIDEAVLQTFGGGADGASAMPAQVGMLTSQLESLTSAGYLTREGQRLKSSIAFKAGQFTANGVAIGGGPGM